MTLREWLLYFHILAAIIWVGGSILLLLQGWRVRTAADGDDRVRFLRTVDFAGKFVFNISGIAVLALGIWIVIDSDVFGFDDWWVSLAMAVVIASAILGMAFYGPQTGKALAIAGDKGGDDPAVVSISDRLLQVASIELVFLLFVLWTMVFKPGS